MKIATSLHRLFILGAAAAVCSGLGTTTACAQSFTDAFPGAALGENWLDSGGSGGASCAVGNKLTLAVTGTDKYGTSWVRAKSKGYSFWNKTLNLSATLGDATLPYGGYIALSLTNSTDAKGVVGYLTPNALALAFYNSGDGYKLALRGKLAAPYSGAPVIATFPTPATTIAGTKIGLTLSNSGGAEGTIQATLSLNDVPYTLTEAELAKLKPLIAAYGGDVMLSMEIGSGILPAASVAVTQFSASAAAK
jgi:hypothetical protein